MVAGSLEPEIDSSPSGVIVVVIVPSMAVTNRIVPVGMIHLSLECLILLVD